MIFYSHFLPAFKAGGPIQSIANMVGLIKDRFLIDIICSASDLGEHRTLPGIEPDKWNVFDMNVHVLYIRTKQINRILSAIHQRKPDVIYVNGIFLPLYSFLPLLLGKLRGCQVVLSPRGMLQRGAMNSGSRKKKLFLGLMRSLRLHKDVTWLASDEQERQDISSHFGENSVVEVIGNVPKSPVMNIPDSKKEFGALRLVYLSLISSKKNLHLVLTTLKDVNTPIVFDIYGPIKDKAYWNFCESLMSDQIHSINYRGVLNPQDVQATLRKYHAFILLSKGENFGHAIYEALSSGIPVIISEHTPWKRLDEHNAGVIVDINDNDQCRAAIEKFLKLNEMEFQTISDGAARLASAYYEENDFKMKYESLFATR